ncbi:tRNA (guanine-N(7)-)-methyltransferase non-catalytic subunit WDR4 [Nilaparvata lugens]|uniref:tRNA (guanine-N(7)-)-methyltransferase non-catalytic subunit WDR4 n=1 Tax=Nilaparvata lugens TaxID=108931 RepID=UPI00193D21CC|nr:tRNA (guanine-N(7)-)-methyltransferase non-catalytic subunit WDR4 [Nilaparvata lugens]
MVSLSCNKQNIALTVENRTIFVNIESQFIKVVELEKNIASSFSTDNQDIDADDSKKTVTYSSSDISKCGKFFVRAHGRNLSLWNLISADFISNRCLQKRANKVRFSPKCDSIVVADKSGDVFLYSVKSPLDAGVLILGHLSMLLDVLISPDEKFIITCDRDEKIRVSSFPNAYKIHTYCLGHEEFVTSIQLLPHCQDILISTSGDGTVKLWDYKMGRLIETLNFSPTAGAAYPDEDTNGAIVTSTSARIANDQSLLCVTVSQQKSVIVFKFSGDLEKIEHYVYTLTLDSEPVDILLDDRSNLWLVLFEKNLKLVVFGGIALFKPSLKEDSNVVDRINQEIINVKEVTFKKDMIPLLFKRSFDNVKDYLKRKNDRICDQNDKKIKLDTPAT